MGNTVQVKTKFIIPRYDIIKREYMYQTYQIPISINPNRSNHSSIIHRAIAAKLAMKLADVQIEVDRISDDEYPIGIIPYLNDHKVIYNQNQQNQFKYTVDYRIPITIKFYSGKNINDYVYDRNYKLHKQKIWVGNGSIWEIVKSLTNNKYIMDSLICEYPHHNNEYYAKIEQSIQNLDRNQNWKGISQMITEYIRDSDRIDISARNNYSTSCYAYDIPADSTIILRRDLSRKYCRYDEIERNDKIVLKFSIQSTKCSYKLKLMDEEFVFDVFATFADVTDSLLNVLSTDSKHKISLEHYGKSVTSGCNAKLIDYGVVSGNVIKVHINV